MDHVNGNLYNIYSESAFVHYIKIIKYIIQRVSVIEYVRSSYCCELNALHFESPMGVGHHYGLNKATYMTCPRRTPVSACTKTQ